MLSKNRLKFIKSLQIKKHRKQYGQFIVEGAKSVAELLHSDYTIHTLLLTPGFFNCYKDLAELRCSDILQVNEKELEFTGTFESNNQALAVAAVKENKEIIPSENEYCLMLDEVKDPGNLGTIIRIADWYGVKKIICSSGSADFYNPKVISASMGSFTRVDVYYTNLEEYLPRFSDRSVYAAVLEGENIYKAEFKKGGFVLMGNESRGISGEIMKYATDKLTIPRFGGAESLNVAIATAVILDNIRRGDLILE